MIRLTKLGIIFFVVMALFYFAALTAQSGLLLLLIGILAGCYLVNLAGSWNVVKFIHIEAPPSIQVPEKERLSDSWRVTNTSRFTAGFFHVELEDNLLFKVGGLASHQTAHVLPNLFFARRGVYSNKSLKILSVYPFGLIRSARVLPINGSVVVVPAVYPTLVPEACGFDLIVGGKLKGQRATSSGVYFSGIRPFQPGDSFRHVHWKSSSKGQGMMVKTFEEELSGRLSFLMDPGFAADVVTSDSCIRATGSLIFSSLDAGHHVEWMPLDGDSAFLIPPFAEGGEILTRLAQVQSALPELEENHFRNAAARVSKKSSINFVLARWKPEWASVIQSLKQNRVVSVFLPETLARGTGLQGIRVYAYTANEIIEGHEKLA